MVKLRDLTMKEHLAPGHRLCAGCGEPIITRQMLKTAKGAPVLVNATGCLEVATSIYPYTSWRVPWAHIAFENAAAVASGVEAAYKAMARRGVEVKGKVIALAGDGGTFDIGLQALSGALERGHDLLYICLDNEAYMNTGIQRSGATPYGASTTTSYAGKVLPGKLEWKKDLMGIVVAHNIPYAATVSPAFWNDLMTKVEKATSIKGPTFIHALAPCPRGWRYDSSDTIKVARLAVMSNFFPLYEVENGVYKLNYKPKQPIPVKEYIGMQGRFRHLLRPPFDKELGKIQEEVDKRWQHLLKLCGET
jgi:pyruvate ferredoxin oxidoreductase beta subunit